MKYLIFLFVRSSAEPKCGVEFRHSAHNAWGESISILTLDSAYFAICGIQYKAEKIDCIHNNNNS